MSFKNQDQTEYKLGKNAFPLKFYLLFSIDPPLQKFQLRETLISNWKWKSAKVIYVTKWDPCKPKIAE